MKFSKKIISVISCLALFLALLGGCSACAAAQRTVRFGCYDLKNFVNKNASGDYYGYGVDYLKMLSSYTGWQCKIVRAPNAELSRMLESGEIDFLMPVQFSAGRLGKFAYPSYPIGEQIDGLYALKNRKNLYYEDFRFFEGLRVGSVENTSPTDTMRRYAREHGFSYKEVLYPDLASLNAACEAGSVDLVCRSALGDIPDDYRLVGATELNPFCIVAAASKKNGPLFMELDKTLKLIRYEHPGFMLQLFYKHKMNRRTPGGSVNLTRGEADYLRFHPTVRVISFSDRYPISYLDGETGKPTGILVDLMELVSARTGLKFEYEAAQQGAVLADELLNSVNNADLAVGLIHNGAYRNGKNLRMSRPILDNTFVIIGRKGASFDPSRGYRVAINAAAPGTISAVREKHPNYSIVTCPSAADSLRTVQRGKADAAVQNVSVLTALLQHPEFNNLSVWFNFENEYEQGYCAASRASADPRLISIVNKGIAALGAEEVRSIVVRRTYAEPEEMTLRDYISKYKVALPLALLLLLVCGTGAFWYLRTKQRTLTTLKKANEELLEANARAVAATEEARRASEAKSDFLSRMSHDIRTPLNGVIGMTSLAAGKNKDPEVAGFLDKIDVSGHFLLTLVNDILDLSKIDAGKMEVHAEPYPAEEFHKYINGVIEPMFKAKGVRLVREGQRFTDRTIIVDKLKYNRIFFNLLSNAAKFTPAGGTVMISLKNYRLEGKTLSYDCVISDEGIGMSERFQRKLFTPFEQERPSGFDDNMGSGLGLAITYRFVRLLGGSITVKSAPGKGSAFTVHFSLPSVPAEQVVKTVPAGSKVDLSGKNILAAEDNDINSEILFHLLKSRGARTVLAKNGAKAVRAFEESEPGFFDAILMDVRMPVMNGKDAARAIRALARPDAKTVPIIAATANAYDEDVEACLAAGMNGHVAKPIEPDQLFAMLSKVMENRSQSENSKN